MTLVPRDARLEAFLLDHHQRFPQRVDQRRRQRVVVLASHPVVLEQPEIEVEAAARHEPRAGGARHRNRTQARRRADALLRAGVGDVDAPSGQVHFLAAERRHGVDDGQRARLAGNRRQLPDRIAHARRGLRVHHAHDVRAVAAELVAQPLWIDRTAPFHVDATNARAVALEDLRQPIAEVAAHDDDAAHPLGDAVGDRRFHRRRAGARRRQRQRFLVCAEDALERGADVIQERYEIGIEVAEHRRRHRADDARGNQAGSGSEKNAFGSGKWQ